MQMGGYVMARSESAKAWPCLLPHEISGWLRTTAIACLLRRPSAPNSGVNTRSRIR